MDLEDLTPEQYGAAIAQLQAHLGELLAGGVVPLGSAHVPGGGRVAAAVLLNGTLTLEENLDAAPDIAEMLRSVANAIDPPAPATVPDAWVN